MIKRAWINIFQSNKTTKIYVGPYNSEEAAALADPENKRIETIPSWDIDTDDN